MKPALPCEVHQCGSFQINIPTIIELICRGTSQLQLIECCKSSRYRIRSQRESPLR